MAQRDLVEQAANGVEEPGAFQEACAVFGDAGALVRLKMFHESLETHLRRIGCDQSDVDALREIAHQTAGRAGLLGFPTLAGESASLEEAIRADIAVARALDRWIRSARLVIERGAEAHKHGTDRET